MTTIEYKDKLLTTMSKITGMRVWADNRSELEPLRKLRKQPVKGY